jgi:hypothetical protein
VPPTVLGAARHASPAATAAEQRMTSDCTRREHDVNALLARDSLPAWERRLEFRPFGLDVHGAPGSIFKEVVQQFAQRNTSARPVR